MSVDIATPEADSSTGGLTRDAALQDGQRFVLVERESGKILMAIGHEALLQACDDMSALHSIWHWHWDCAIEGGWVTLRNRVTKKYLGSDSCGGYLIVASRSMTFTGHLVVTRSSGGGQTLSAPYAKGIKLVHDAGRNVSAKLKLGTTKGLEWEFVRLESQ
ncbi:hypothetical protein E4U17_002436 [Claviceps sp. LM77 group G4]|nr:hypothetical protein E4U17_002436 [Claviceps sp. LM77 group G4]KAG6074624.1 hypothetical protein E4U33_002428 [Claviceps sp. LM78 group G4]KAG6076538.1 hypothetical protein E4U16_002735 [Claviceps sp. LM84 group G4]